MSRRKNLYGSRLLLLGFALILFHSAPIISHAEGGSDAFTFSRPDPALHELPQVRVAYYDIFGTTAEQLRAQMESKGPADQFGKRRDAYTRWYIHWEWPTDQKNLPIYAKTKAECRLTVILPRWMPPEGASPKLKKQWKAFIQAVTRHERNHIRFAQENYQKIEQRIKEAALSNPSLGDQEAHDIAQEVIGEIRDSDLAYDQRTESGRKEGVIF